jgi:hypothetical protein
MAWMGKTLPFSLSHWWYECSTTKLYENKNGWKLSVYKHHVIRYARDKEKRVHVYQITEMEIRNHLTTQDALHLWKLTQYLLYTPRYDGG